MIAQDSLSFRTGYTWQQVLDSARKRDKLVFVDVYTDWCLPCRRMEKEVFTRPEVVQAMNKEFLLYRLDAEKGEGPEIAERYGANGYPCFLFVDGQGRLFYSVLGFRTAQQLLEDTRTAVSERNDPRPLAVWEEEYAQNQDNTDWLQEYIRKRNKLRMDNETLTDRLFTLKPEQELLHPDVLQLVAESRVIRWNGPAFRFLTTHFRSIPNLNRGASSLPEKILSVLEGSRNKLLMQVIEERDEKRFREELLPVIGAMPDSVPGMPWYQRSTPEYWMMVFFRETGNVDGFRTPAQAVMETYLHKPVADIRKIDSILYARTLSVYRARLETEDRLNQMLPLLQSMLEHYSTDNHVQNLQAAAGFLEAKGENRSDREQALRWCLRAIEIRPSAGAHELAARLYLKLNQKKNAVSHLSKAAGLSTTKEEKDRLLQQLNSL
jgi:thiol-disulfide isomerase/thioredoxin